MADVIMPKMSDSMEEGKVLQWMKQPGDQVEKGEAIAEIETDKANVELEAPDAGVLGEIRTQEGESVPVGTVIATIVPAEEMAGAKGGAAVEALPREAKPAPPPEEEKKEEPAPAPPPPVAEERPAPPPAEEEKALEAPPAEGVPHPHPEGVKSSPLARKIAQDAGVDLSEITGTGPGGRIVEADVREYLQRGAQPRPEAPPARPAPPPTAAAPAPTPPELAAREMEVGNIWRVLGRRMTESKQQVPHFYVTIEADMDEALRIREMLNASRPEDRQISVNDIVIKACAMTLVKHPTVNASFVEEGKIQLHDTVNIGIAVALPNGLVAPVVRNCERKSLSTISAEAKEIIRKTKEGRIEPQDYEGGTFTVSNLGMYGVDEFVAIINPPQAAILAVGAALPKPVVVDDELKIRHRMRMTASGDHRVTDGARIAEFLRDLKQLLEEPINLLE